ncbi:MAG TPA: hypothetical protein VGM81_25645 [Burkholderiaceae bacterium]
MRPLLAFAQDILNLAPAQGGARDLVRTRFNQCMLLAVLLHIWLVVVLGSASGGNAPPGEGAYGSLSVRLQGPVAQAGADASVQPPDSGPTGEARQQRSGGTVRPVDEPVRQDQAGAQTTGNWRPMESQADPNLAEPLPATPQVKPLTPSTVETLPELPRPTATLSDTPQQPAPTKLAPTAKLAPDRAPELTPLATPNFEALHPAATMSDITTRAVLAPAAPSPSKLSAVKMPELAPLPTQDFDELRPTATLSETTARPAPAATRPPAKLPASATPNLAPLPSHSLDTIAAPVERRTATLGESISSSPPVQASEVPRTPAKLPSANVPELSPLPKVDAVGPAATAPQAAMGDAPKGATASPNPSPGGAPNAGAQMGHDIATAPSAKPGPKPLNLNLPLARGPMASSHGSTGVLPLMPKPPELKSDIEKAIEKGKRVDCRNAYGENGLLAVVPLAIDAARDKGCKW